MAAFCLASGASASAVAQDGGPPPFTIEHGPAACVVAGRHPMITATVYPAEGVAGGKVHFRTSGRTFAVALEAERGYFAAVLPAPKPGLREFRYWLELVGDDSRTARTSEYAVKVARAKDCPFARDVVKPEADVLVETADAGAGKRALVPEGFSTIGVVGGRKGAGTGRIILSGVALGAVGGGAALASTGKKGQPGVSGQPSNSIQFIGSNPPLNSRLSTRADSLVITFLIQTPVDIPPGNIRLLLARQAGNNFLGNTPCLQFVARHNGFLTNVPQQVELGGSLASATTTLDCGVRYRIEGARISIDDGSQERLRTGTGFLPDVRVRYDVEP